MDTAAPMLKASEDTNMGSPVTERSAVRYGNYAPEQARVCLEEIVATINLVAQQFDGDAAKTAAWFNARNPLLGDASPCDMIRLGRYQRLRSFIMQAMKGQTITK